MEDRCKKIMVNLMRIRTIYADKKWEALLSKDKEEIMKCNKKIKEIDEILKDLRKLYMK